MSDNPNDKAISVLNDLIETCKDGAKGFSTAAEDADSANLKSVFAKYAAQRTAFVSDLDGAVMTLGGKPAETGHVSGVVHRGWINLKAAVSGNDDKAILNECERGEDYAKKAYSDALKENLPGEVRAVVERQQTDIIAAHDKIRDLRNQANAMADGAKEARVNTSAETLTEPVYRD
jgi:uncharacterized protein (TIGR02284 family)